MEQIKLPEVQVHEVEMTSATCVNCQSRMAIPGHATNLCGECRTAFVKYPIPLWIKLFAGGVCLVILFSLFTFPDKLSVAIHLSRGKKAADNNKFVTARNELQKVINKYPKHVEARAYLMLAAFYNEDYTAFSKYAEELQNVDIEDRKLLARLVEAQNTVEAYLADDSVRHLQNKYDSLGTQVPDTVMAQLVKNNPRNYSALYTYASTLYNAQRYAACDSILVQLLEEDDTHIPSLQLMANAKRQRGDFNAAIKYCERILEINKESAYTYGIMSRVYLQQRRDKEGLDMAYKAMSIDQKYPYARATMALAYHFTHQYDKRDQLVKEAKASKDPNESYFFDYVNDVISNKQQFR